MEAETTIVVQLNSIDELFVAPSVNPFSTHEVDILGQAGIDVAQKHFFRHWPRRPRAVRLTVQLPADQVTPGHDAGRKCCASDAIAPTRSMKTACNAS